MSNRQQTTQQIRDIMQNYNNNIQTYNLNMIDIRDLIIIFLTTLIFLLLVNQNQRREAFKNKKRLKYSSIY